MHWIPCCLPCPHMTPACLLATTPPRSKGHDPISSRLSPLISYAIGLRPRNYPTPPTLTLRCQQSPLPCPCSDLQDDWLKRAELAVAKGEDDLAREALSRRKAYQDNSNSMKIQLEAQQKAVDQLIANTR
jgi:hypothetical protein